MSGYWPPNIVRTRTLTLPASGATAADLLSVDLAGSDYVSLHPTVVARAVFAADSAAASAALLTSGFALLPADRVTRLGTRDQKANSLFLVGGTGVSAAATEGLSYWLEKEF